MRRRGGTLLRAGSSTADCASTPSPPACIPSLQLLALPAPHQRHAPCPARPGPRPAGPGRGGGGRPAPAAEGPVRPPPVSPPCTSPNPQPPTPPPPRPPPPPPPPQFAGTRWWKAAPPPTAWAPSPRQPSCWGWGLKHGWRRCSRGQQPTRQRRCRRGSGAQCSWGWLTISGRAPPAGTAGSVPGQHLGRQRRSKRAGFRCAGWVGTPHRAGETAALGGK